MKLKNIKILSPLLLISTILMSGCGGSQRQHYTLPTEDYTDPNEYYYGFQFAKKGVRMIEQLQLFSWQKHTKYVTYQKWGSYVLKNGNTNGIDAVSDGSTKIEYFYTGAEASSKGTREHVWPCAKSSGLWVHGGSSTDPGNVDKESTYIGGGSDLYHVRPSSSKVNTARGDSKFVDFDDFPDMKAQAQDVTERDGKYPIKIYGLDDHGEYGTYAEPADEFKGDIARILCYCYIHYGNTVDLTSYPEYAKYAKYTGGLSFNNVMGYNERTCKEKLVEWNEIDPPSEVEMLRNNTIQGIQGNRNPFVDFPGLMARMFNLD